MSSNLHMLTITMRFAVSAGERARAMAKILHLKSENKRGSQIVVGWMQRWCHFAANSYADEYLNIVEAWLSAGPKPGLQLNVG